MPPTSITQGAQTRATEFHFQISVGNLNENYKVKGEIMMRWQDSEGKGGETYQWNDHVQARKVAKLTSSTRQVFT